MIRISDIKEREKLTERINHLKKENDRLEKLLTNQAELS